MGDTYVNYGLGNYLWYHHREPDSGILRLTIRDGEVVGDGVGPGPDRHLRHPEPLAGPAVRRPWRTGAGSAGAPTSLPGRLTAHPADRARSRRPWRSAGSPSRRSSRLPTPQPIRVKPAPPRRRSGSRRPGPRLRRSVEGREAAAPGAPPRRPHVRVLHRVDVDRRTVGVVGPVVARRRPGGSCKPRCCRPPWTGRRRPPYTSTSTIRRIGQRASYSRPNTSVTTSAWSACDHHLPGVRPAVEADVRHPEVAQVRQRDRAAGTGG